VISGGILAVVQLDRLDALWTTSYGLVLSCKLAAVTAFIALGAANRYVFVPRYVQGDTTASRPLTRTMTVELCIVAVILAWWRPGGSRRRHGRWRRPSRSRCICTASAPWRNYR
jgi:copper transport protein